ncbi:hypothetical protein ACLMAL_38805 [Nocardia sp. CWNU-33]|uniref:hypothetical protein n=1 Tax=Nocardia sp. CWNU-33 TaxID=3392117 RepID=UPI00398EF8C9
MTENIASSNARGPAPISMFPVKEPTLSLEYVDGWPTLRVSEGQAIPLAIKIVDATGQQLALYLAGTADAAPSPTDPASPRVTNWGSWGVWGECQPGEFVVGMKSKTAPKQGLDDDTALNAIRLLCAAPGSNGSNFRQIQVHEGPWGELRRAWVRPRWPEAGNEPVSR